MRIVIISCAGRDDPVNEDDCKMKKEKEKRPIRSLESLHCSLNHRARQHIPRLSSPGFSTSSNSVFLPEFSLSNYFTDTGWSILIQPMEPNNHLLHRQATPAVLSSVRKQNYCKLSRLIHPFTLPHATIWFRCCVTLHRSSKRADLSSAHHFQKALASLSITVLRPNNVNVYLLLSSHQETDSLFANLLKPEIETHNGRL